MKYRLKDQELQRHLDSISDGDFSRQIECNLRYIKGRGTTDADYRLFFWRTAWSIRNRKSVLDASLRARNRSFRRVRPE